MPKWKTHDKWAARMGIPHEVSEYINRLIDLQGSKKPSEFKDF
jgi:hypothetical protein